MGSERERYWRAVHDEAVRAGEYHVVSLIHEVCRCELPLTDLHEVELARACGPGHQAAARRPDPGDDGAGEGE